MQPHFEEMGLTTWYLPFHFPGAQVFGHRASATAWLRICPPGFQVTGPSGAGGSHHLALGPR